MKSTQLNEQAMRSEQAYSGEHQASALTRADSSCTNAKALQHISKWIGPRMFICSFPILVWRNCVFYTTILCMLCFIIMNECEAEMRNNKDHAHLLKVLFMAC
jgi:hypothetical protein